MRTRHNSRDPHSRMILAASAVGLLLALGTRVGAADDLWDKAVRAAAHTNEAGIVFGTLRMDTTTSKTDGTVEEERSVVYQSVEEKGELKAVVVRATKNGKDATEEARREEESDKVAQGKDEGSVSISLEPDYHPFDPEVQAQVTCRRLGPKTIDGRQAVEFDFKHVFPAGAGTCGGKAWLDADNGLPIQIEVSPDPLPKHTKQMTTRLRFRVTDQGYWVPVEGEIRAEGSFLWIRRVVESRFTFSDFRKREGH